MHDKVCSKTKRSQFNLLHTLILCWHDKKCNSIFRVEFDIQIRISLRYINSTRQEKKKGEGLDY